MKLVNCKTSLLKQSDWHGSEDSQLFSIIKISPTGETVQLPGATSINSLLVYFISIDSRYRFTKLKYLL